MFLHACVYLLALGHCASLVPPVFNFNPASFLISDLMSNDEWLIQTSLHACSDVPSDASFSVTVLPVLLWYCRIFSWLVSNDAVHYPWWSACFASCGPTSEGWGIPGLEVGSRSGNSSHRSQNLRTDRPSEFGAPPSRAFNIEGNHFTGREEQLTYFAVPCCAQHWHERERERERESCTSAWTETMGYQSVCQILLFP
jgi:hypothetical protein